MLNKSLITPILLLLAIIAADCRILSAREVDTSKKSYHLFNPVPRDMMRDLSTDRPDQTESPITVDAGHIQIEADAVFYTYNKFEQTKDNGFSIAAINLKVGLTNFADIQFILPSYTRIKTKFDNQESTVDGVSDLITRLKINIIGNDKGKFALGIMPIVKWPTASSDLGNDEFEWGVVIPISLELPNDFGAGAMVKFDYLTDIERDERYTSMVLTGAIGRSLTDAVGAFVEIVGEKSFIDDSQWQSIFSTGLIYGVNKDLQIDAGVFAGLTDEVVDLQVFCGVSFRR
jgi:Putative MetA-pathway of phenol degradation